MTCTNFLYSFVPTEKRRRLCFGRLFWRQHQSLALLCYVLAVQHIPTNCYFNDSLIWHCLVCCSQITKYKLSAWIIKSQRSKLSSMYMAHRSIYIHINIMGSREWAISDRSQHHILPYMNVVHCMLSIFCFSTFNWDVCAWVSVCCFVPLSR